MNTTSNNKKRRKEENQKKNNTQTSIRMKIDMVNELLNSDETFDWDKLIKDYLENYWNGYYFPYSNSDDYLLNEFREEKEYIIETINEDFLINILDMNSSNVVTEKEKEWGSKDDWTDKQWDEVGDEEQETLLMETYTTGLSDYFYDYWEIIVKDYMNEKVEDLKKLFKKYGFDDIDIEWESEPSGVEYSVWITLDSETFCFHYNNIFELEDIDFEYEIYDKDYEWEDNDSRYISMDELPKILKERKKIFDHINNY